MDAPGHDVDATLLVAGEAEQSMDAGEADDSRRVGRQQDLGASTSRNVDFPLAFGPTRT